MKRLTNGSGSRLLDSLRMGPAVPDPVNRTRLNTIAFREGPELDDAIAEYLTDLQRHLGRKWNDTSRTSRITEFKRMNNILSLFLIDTEWNDLSVVENSDMMKTLFSIYSLLDFRTA
jgi:hypothetical protein